MDKLSGTLNERESLQLIREMIDKAKNDLGAQAFYPILWGWIVLIGSLGHFLLLRHSSFERPYMVWLIIIIGIIGSIAKGYNQRKTTSASTYSSTIVAVVWVVFLVNYFILLPFIDEINFLVGPIVLLMSGGSIFLCGFILKFKPFYFGGIFTWIMAIVAFMVSMEFQLLVSAAAVLFGLLIPGYILKNGKEQ